MLIMVKQILNSDIQTADLLLTSLVGVVTGETLFSLVFPFNKRWCNELTGGACLYLLKHRHDLSEGVQL